ncbi:hypothetical protein C5F48_02455 [Cereibacter changlensis JA139]|uniref:Uncharacterized protein n=1 Tax=Cereibacter changlensis JA139 TaxID=1188249 RepID=A0A2T4K012_9RHOB|nr:hypothetical protein C5F48_02455 [Cereibacter changlensis JA139]
MSGSEGIEQIGSGDRSGLAWPKGHHFVSEELLDTERYPRGRVLLAEDALDQLEAVNRHANLTPFRRPILMGGTAPVPNVARIAVMLHDQGSNKGRFHHV